MGARGRRGRPRRRRRGWREWQRRNIWGRRRWREEHAGGGGDQCEHSVVDRAGDETFLDRDGGCVCDGRRWGRRVFIAVIRGHWACGCGSRRPARWRKCHGRRWRRMRGLRGRFGGETGSRQGECGGDFREAGRGVVDGRHACAGRTRRGVSSFRGTETGTQLRQKRGTETGTQLVFSATVLQRPPFQSGRSTATPRTPRAFPLTAPANPTTS